MSEKASGVEVSSAYRQLKDDTEARALDEYREDCAREDANHNTHASWCMCGRCLVFGE